MTNPVRLRRVILALATGDKTHDEIAAEFDCSRQVISRVNRKYREAIDQAAKAIDDEYAGILYADQANRLAAYDNLAQRLLANPDLPREPGLMRAVLTALKSIAEERGHLPGRVTVQGSMDTRTRYTIDGVSDEDLT